MGSAVLEMGSHGSFAASWGFREELKELVADDISSFCFLTLSADCGMIGKLCGMNGFTTQGPRS